MAPPMSITYMKKVPPASPDLSQLLKPVFLLLWRGGGCFPTFRQLGNQA